MLKASLAELTTDENKGRAFACVARPLAIADSESSADGPFIAAHASLIAQTWAVGAALGPLIGGWCAPGGLMERPPVAAFPFLLPCLVSALFPLVGALVAGQFLVETLPAKAVDAPDQPSEPVLPIRDLLTPQVRALLVTYAMLALQTISLAALLPLFAFTPIASGGLGFSTAAIGTAMRCVGIRRRALTSQLLRIVGRSDPARHLPAAATTLRHCSSVRLASPPHADAAASAIRQRFTLRCSSPTPSSVSSRPMRAVKQPGRASSEESRERADLPEHSSARCSSAASPTCAVRRSRSASADACEIPASWS